MNNAEFSEAVAQLLCLPSPACVDWVGEKVGRKEVDRYGNNVMNEPLPGDHCTVGGTGTSGPNNSVHLLVAIEN